jgi:hypothetical protein
MALYELQYFYTGYGSCPVRKCNTSVTNPYSPGCYFKNLDSPLKWVLTGNAAGRLSRSPGCGGNGTASNDPAGFPSSSNSFTFKLQTDVNAHLLRSYRKNAWEQKIFYLFVQIFCS